MLTVACVRWGEAFGVEYVERLYDMVRRNLPAGFPGRFVCLTDKPEELAHLKGVETQLLPPGLKGWWNKAVLFKPGTFESGSRVIYFDLDTVITGPLDRFAQYPGAFALLRDVYRKEGFQSSVMAFIAGTKLTDSIWEEFNARTASGLHSGRVHADTLDSLWPGGDQQFLEHFWAQYLPQRIKGDPWPPDFLQAVLPGYFRSYKIDCVWSIPRGTGVVFFHGVPRPHQVLTGWVPEVWKVGGGTANEFVQVGTVEQSKVLANIQVNRAKGLDEVQWLPWANSLTAVIVGGGPSLEAYLLSLASLKKGGAVLFTVNGVEGYLRSKGLQGNFHVMMDARPQMRDMICEGGIKLYASMMDPSVIDAAKTQGYLALWHAATEGAEELIPKGMMIGSGSTVGVRAMALAFAMGFRKVLCVGFDSCYAQGAHHAYPQSLNDGDRVLDCIMGGERFKAAPWMVQQAEDWKATARALTQNGCEVSVFGEGLIGAVARTMNDQFVEVDGLWWPSHDIEARKSILATIEDCAIYAHLAPGAKVAVQAGACVGVWPLELAKHFETVYTFEPDPENFACLARNVHGRGDIKIHQAALGAGAGTTGIERRVGNCGASRVAPAQEGPIPVMAIDSLNLPACDLLQLDVEGYELEALKGARATILRYLPLIVLELKGHGADYGTTDQEIIQWLEALGYRRTGHAHRDVVFQALANLKTEDLAHG